MSHALSTHPPRSRDHVANRSFASSYRREFTKMRRTATPIAVVLLSVALGGTPLVFFLRDGALATAGPQTLLNWMAMVAVCLPPAVAVSAGRQVDMERQSGMWNIILGTDSRLSDVLMAKWAAVATLIVAAVMLSNVCLAVLAAGPGGFNFWLVNAMLVSLLAVGYTGLHVCLSYWVPQQLANTAIGVAGSLIAIYSLILGRAAASLTPWGYLALSSAATTTDSQVIYTSPYFFTVCVAAAVFIALATALTRVFEKGSVR